MITFCGQILVSRTDDDLPLTLPVCTLKTSPCVPAPHPHVFTHVDVLNVHTETFWMYTRGFSACHSTHHTTSHTQPQPQSHNDTQPTCSFIRLNTEKLTRSRHSKDWQIAPSSCFDGARWPFKVGGMIFLVARGCLVNSVNNRDQSWLNHNKYDSCLITCQ